MKATKVYELLVRVTDTNLSTVIDVLANAAEIVKLTPYSDDEPAVRKPSYHKHRGGNGISVDSVVFGAMVPGKQHNAKELGKKLEAAGFSATSVHPSLSALCTKKKVRRVAPNTYELV